MKKEITDPVEIVITLAELFDDPGYAVKAFEECILQGHWRGRKRSYKRIEMLCNKSKNTTRLIIER